MSICEIWLLNRIPILCILCSFGLCDTETGTIRRLEWSDVCGPGKGTGGIVMAAIGGLIFILGIGLMLAPFRNISQSIHAKKLDEEQIRYGSRATI